MSDSGKKQSRRDFLRQSLMASASVSPLSLFLSNMASHYITNATALAQGIPPSQMMNMFTLYLGGGPARWVWDQALSPKSEIADLKNPSLITKFGQGFDNAPGVYKSVSIDGVYLPHMWSGKIPTVDGSVPMEELAHHMLAIRGIGNPNDGHDNNASKLITPVSGPNIPGLLSDLSTRPLPSVGLTGSSPFFKSSKGVSHISVSESGNMLYAALSPFTLSRRISGQDGQLLYDGDFGLPRGTASSTEALFDQFFTAMSQNSGALHRYLPSTYQDRRNAKRLMMQDFSSLSSVFSNLTLKYTTLVQRCFNDSSLFLEGVDDSPVVGNKDNPFLNIQCETPSVSGRGRYSGADLRMSFSNSTAVIGLVSSFVLAEYMLTMKYSQSVMGMVRGINSLQFDQLTSVDNLGNSLSASNNEIGAFSLDQHFCGASSLLLMNTRFYRAISACLYELISVLKNTDGNMFNKTAINIISEFSRNTFAGGAETGHGYKGVPFSMFSGMIKKAHVIGNIGYEFNNTTALTSRGLWGAAASMQTMGDRPINAGNVASTIATVIGVPSPSPNNMSLVKIEDNEIKPLVDEKENIT